MKSFIDEQKFHFDKLYQQVQLESQPIYPGNKKCFGGIKMVKYQERLLKTNGNGQGGEEIVINECRRLAIQVCIILIGMDICWIKEGTTW